MEDRKPLSLGLLRHHLPALAGMGRVGLRSILPRRAPAAQVAPLTRTIPAPPQALVEHYLDWCGAAGRYPDTLPPHMVSQWGIAVSGALLMQTAYPLARILNQGVILKIHGPLPRGVPLQLRASLCDVDGSQPGKLRFSVAIETGTAQQRKLLDTFLHLTIVQPGPREKRVRQTEDAPQHWSPAGSWQADADDGLRFALLTGDFNPIHWFGPVARRSVFGGKVLHGFGTLVRSMETLDMAALREIDVRFVRPVPLPSAALRVEHGAADDQGWRALRVAGSDATIHLLGRYR